MTQPKINESQVDYNDIALSGNSTATTQIVGTNNTTIATTAFVNGEILNINYTSINLPGNPTTTTQSPGNNTTRIATTAFVQNALSSSGGFPNGSWVSAGSTIGVSHSNTTGKPMLVIASIGSASGVGTSVYVNGSQISDSQLSGGSALTSSYTFLVPIGGSYILSGTFTTRVRRWAY